jgi:hypothetical protein
VGWTAEERYFLLLFSRYWDECVAVLAQVGERMHAKRPWQCCDAFFSLWLHCRYMLLLTARLGPHEVAWGSPQPQNLCRACPSSSPRQTTTRGRTAPPTRIRLYLHLWLRAPPTEVLVLTEARQGSDGELLQGSPRCTPRLAAAAIAGPRGSSSAPPPKCVRGTSATPPAAVRCSQDSSQEQCSHHTCEVHVLKQRVC